MQRIFVTRHGQDRDNANGILNGRRDQSLTHIGLEQAQATAGKIRNVGLRFDAVYSSPLRRAFQTAEILSRIAGAPTPQPLDVLIERDFGVMTGELVASIETKCAPDIIKTEKIVYFLNPEGAETFPQLLERGKVALEEIIKRHHDGNILIVTHGDIGKMIYAVYYGLDWKEVLTLFHFGNTDILELSEESKAHESHLFENRYQQESGKTA